MYINHQQAQATSALRYAGMLLTQHFDLRPTCVAAMPLFRSSKTTSTVKSVERLAVRAGMLDGYNKRKMSVYHALAMLSVVVATWSRGTPSSISGLCVSQRTGPPLSAALPAALQTPRCSREYHTARRATLILLVRENLVFAKAVFRVYCRNITARCPAAVVVVVQRTVHTVHDEHCEQVLQCYATAPESLQPAVTVIESLSLGSALCTAFGHA